MHPNEQSAAAAVLDARLGPSEEQAGWGGRVSKGKPRRAL